VRNLKSNHLLLALVLLLTFLSRFWSHQPNFSLVFAGLIFSAALFVDGASGETSIEKKLLVYLASLSVLFVSDIILGVYAGISFVYLSYALILFVGHFTNRRSFISLGSAALLSPMIFFIVSNFGVWFSTAMYAKTGAGLVECYLMALPFYKNTLISSLFGTAVFYSLISVIERYSLLSLKYQTKAENNGRI
jgi:hypothetical protein